MVTVESDVPVSLVQALKNLFCQRGIPVVLYNSRGVGKSSGRASWTGEAERKDYQAVVEWVTDNHPSAPGSEAEGSKVVSRLVIYCCVSISNSFPVQQPPCAALNSRFRGQGYSFGSVMAGQATSPAPTQTGPQVELRYIIISPPISSFVGFLLTPFRAGNLAISLKRIASQEGERIDAEEAPTKSKVLIIYGGRDDFTNVSTYHRWTSEVSEVAGPVHSNRIDVREIHDADHFWSNPRCKTEMLEAVCSWL